MDERIDLAVIGAGIAGLAAAGEARRAGLRAIVLDKGRGVGGRMSTRRLDPGIADHGAQLFTVTHPGFRDAVKAAADVVVPWASSFPGDDRDRVAYRGTDGMSALPRHLARDLAVSTSVRVTAIRPGPDGHAIRAEDGRTWSSRAVVLTAPVPQSLAILDAGGVAIREDLRAALEIVEYDPCFAVLVVLDGPSRVPEPGGLRLSEGPLAWIADNRLKGVSPDVTTLTLHASAEFSRRHLEADRSEVGRCLLEAAQPWLDSRVREVQVHRWRYALVRRGGPSPCVALETSAPLVLAGDAFGGPRVEAAFLSGVAAGRAIVGRLTGGFLRP